MKKNIFKFAGVFTLIVAIFAISTAFTGKETKSASSKNVTSNPRLMYLTTFGKQLMI